VKISPRIRSARFALIALVALLVGGMLTLGMSATAFAVPGLNSPVPFTLKLTNKAGVALSGYDVYPIQLANGSEVPNDPSEEAVPVSGKPGYYSMTLLSGDTYTLWLSPVSSALSGNFQLLGGTTTLSVATQFVPTSANDFLAASIATGGTITGKVTGPTGAVLKGAEVDAYRFDGSNWDDVAYTTTSATGAYTIANAVPGSYKLEFYSPNGVYPPIYSGSASTLTAAASTFLPVGVTATINQKMTAGTGSISGTAHVDFDGEEFYDNGRTPVAIPVTAQSGGVATGIDLDKSVAGAPSGSTGVWAIKNLIAGSYVVQMDPKYFGERQSYLSSAGDTASLAQAKILVVTAGHVTATGLTIFQGSFEQDGADPHIQVFNSSNAAIANANVEVAPTTDPTYYAFGTSNSSGVVTLEDQSGTPIFDDGQGDGLDNPLEPGWYTITVIDPSGQHEPYSQNTYLDFGESTLSITLPDLIAAPGFSTGPSLDTTDTAAGTTYTVTATSTRATADLTYSAAPDLTYQWLNNGVAIYGAIGTSYTSTGADVGDQLSVRVAEDSFGFNPVYAEAAVGGNATPTPTTIGDAAVNSDALPSVTPTTGVFVGTTLQAHVGDWTLDSAAATGMHYQYVWSVDGTPIVAPTPATGSTYVVQPTDVGKQITVSVKATKPGYADSAYAVSTDDVVPGLHPAALVTKSPVITAKALKGVTTYTVTAGTWNTTGLTYSYAWSLGGTVVSTTSTVTTTTTGALPAASALTVVVTAHKTGYADGHSATLVAVKGTTAFFQTADPTIHDITTDADVSGTDSLNFGDHLTVSAHGSWDPINGVSPSGYTYQWYRAGVAVKGATTVNYTISTADLPNLNTTAITVVETPVSAYYVGVHGEQSLVGIAKSINLPAIHSAVTLSGVPADGRTITVIPGTFAVTAVTSTYAWYYCPVASSCTDPTNVTLYLPITGATKNTLLLHLSYGSVYVLTTYSKLGYNGGVVGSNIMTVLPATTIVQTSAPKITGTVTSVAHVGVKLTATPSTATVAAVLNAYAWQTEECNPAPCDPDGWTTVGTAATYTPTPTDYASGSTFIRVLDTASKGADTPATTASATYAIGLGALKLTKAAVLTSTAVLEKITPATYSPAATADVHWFVDGTDLGSAPSRDHSAVADAGKAIYAVTTYSLAGYASITSPVVVAQKGATPVPTAETITGAPKYGTTLGVSVAEPFTDALVPSPSARTLTYQWYENGVAIAGAVHATYAPPYTYIGRHITVRVTGASTLYATGTVLSTAITLGSGTFSGSESDPTLSYTGTLQPGTAVTAVPDTLVNYGTTGITFKYQWQRSTNGGVSWTSIVGGTLAKYTPVATDATDELRVYVAASKVGFVSVGLYSAESTVQYSPTLATFTPPTLSGTGKVAGPLVLSAGVWNTPTLTYVYKWYRNGVLIPGVTGTTWTPTADSVGEIVVATVTASRVGWQPVTVSSQALLVAPADAPVATVAPVVTFVAATDTYTVSTGTWTVDGLTYSYQWQLDGADGTGLGATTNSYTRSGSDSGLLSVVITATRTGYAPVTITVNGPTLQPLG
jgi:hypothetical protein